MITLARSQEIAVAVRAAGCAPHIERSENPKPPTSSTQYAAEAIHVIVNSGMRNSVAHGIFERCMVAVRAAPRRPRPQALCDRLARETGYRAATSNSLALVNGAGRGLTSFCQNVDIFGLYLL